MSDQKTLLDRMAGTWGIEEGGGFPGEALRQLFDLDKNERLAADGAAGTVIANTKFWSNPYSYPVQIVAMSVNVDANAAGDPTNFGSLLLNVDDALGGAPVNAAFVNTNTGAGGGGNWVAGVDEVATLVPANCVVQPGANVFYQQTKAGTGVQFGIRTLKMRLRRV